MAEKNLPHHPAPVQYVDDIKKVANNLLNYNDIFLALHELLQSSISTPLSLSAEGREGLAYMFKLLADDAEGLSWIFLTAWEELKKVHNLQEEKEGVEA